MCCDQRITTRLYEDKDEAGNWHMRSKVELKPNTTRHYSPSWCLEDGSGLRLPVVSAEKSKHTVMQHEGQHLSLRKQHVVVASCTSCMWSSMIMHLVQNSMGSLQALCRSADAGLLNNVTIDLRIRLNTDCNTVFAQGYSGHNMITESAPGRSFI